MRLRVGCLLDCPRAAAWVAKVLDDIRAAEFLELALVILAPAGIRQRPSLWQRIRGALYRLYQWADYKMFKAAKDALAPVDLGNLCAEVSCLRLTACADDPHDPWTQGDLQAIAAAGLDVILDFSALDVRGGIVRCAKHGIWSCHLGEARAFRGMPPLMWEMYQDIPMSETVLQCLVEGYAGARILHRRPCVACHFSLYLNRNASLWNSATHVLQRLTDLHQHGWAHLARLDTFASCDQYSKRTNPTPNNWTTIKFVVRMLSRYLAKRLDHWWRPGKWIIGLWARRSDAALPFLGEALRFLLPPEDRFYADPICISRGQKDYLFFEEYRYQQRTCSISYAEIDELGNCTEPRTVLEADCDLSFPFLFEWQGEVYLMPATPEHQTIELYRAVEFPHRWTFDRVVMDNVRAVDSTILSFGGRFWLFTSIESPSGAFGTELSLFYAETPLGPWTPHPQNPVVCDVRCARPAGGFFMLGDALIRPGQDGWRRYGQAVALNKVETLTTTEYREKTIGHLGPPNPPGILAAHTFSHNARFNVVDLWVPVRKSWWRRGRPLKGDPAKWASRWAGFLDLDKMGS